MVKGLWIILLFAALALAEEDGYLETDKAIINAFSGFGRGLRSANGAQLVINMDDMEETQENAKRFVMRSPFLWAGFGLTGIAFISFVAFLPLALCCCKNRSCFRIPTKSEKKYCFPMLVWGSLSVVLCAFCALAFASGSVMRGSFTDVMSSIDYLYETVDSKLTLKDHPTIKNSCEIVDNIATSYKDQLTYYSTLPTKYTPTSFTSLKFTEILNNQYLCPTPGQQNCFETPESLETVNDELDDIADEVTQQGTEVANILNTSAPFYTTVASNSDLVNEYADPLKELCDDQKAFVAEMTEMVDTMKGTIETVTGDIDSRSNILVGFSIAIFCLPILGIIGMLVAFFIRKKKLFLVINWYILFSVTLLLLVGSISITLASAIGAVCSYSDDNGAIEFVPSSKKDIYKACAQGIDIFSIVLDKEIGFSWNNVRSTVTTPTLTFNAAPLTDLSAWSQDVYEHVRDHLFDVGQTECSAYITERDNVIDETKFGLCSDNEYKSACQFALPIQEAAFFQAYKTARDLYESTEQSVAALPGNLQTIRSSMDQVADVIEEIQKTAKCNDITLAADGVRDEICSSFINSFDSLTFMSFLVSLLLVIFFVNGFMLMKAFTKSSGTEDYDIELN